VFGVGAIGAVWVVWFPGMIKEYAASNGKRMVHRTEFWNAQLQLTLHEMLMFSFKGVPWVRSYECTAMDGSR